MTEEELGRLKPRTVVYSTLLDPKAKVGDLQHCEHSGSNLGDMRLYRKNQKKR